MSVNGETYYVEHKPYAKAFPKATPENLNKRLMTSSTR